MHLGALYPAFLSQSSLSYLVVIANIYNLPLMYEYYEARHATLLSPDTPTTPGFNHLSFQVTQQYRGLAQVPSSII
jgi:hypothetical protein